MTPSAAATICPRSTRSPGATRGFAGSPMCCDNGNTMRFGGGMTRMGEAVAASFMPGNSSPPRNRCRRSAIGRVLHGRQPLLRLRPLPVADGDRYLDHVDAIDGAGRDTELAAGAFGPDHRVHLLGRADDGVHRAGLDAQRAAYAGLFIDDGEQLRFLDAVLGAERLGFAIEEFRQCADAGLAAGRTLVDVRLALGDRLGIGPAAGIAAL